MSEWIVAALLGLGAFMAAVAGLGLARLPDLYTRMHASTKPATLGVSLIVAALAVHFADLGIAARALAVVLFFLLTAPVAAHRIGRAAYHSGVRPEGVVHDALASPEATARAMAPRRRRRRRAGA